MSVPGWVYKRMAMGEISVEEVEQLEKLSSYLSKEASLASTLVGGSVGAGLGALGAGEDNRGRGALVGGITGGIGGNLVSKGVSGIGDSANLVSSRFLDSVDPSDLNRISDTKLQAVMEQRKANPLKAVQTLLGPEEGGLVGDIGLSRKFEDFSKRDDILTDKEGRDAARSVAMVPGGLGLATVGAAGAGRLSRKKDEQEKQAYYDPYMYGSMDVTTKTDSAELTDRQLRNKMIQARATRPETAMRGAAVGALAGGFGGLQGKLSPLALAASTAGGALIGGLGGYGSSVLDERGSKKQLDLRQQMDKKAQAISPTGVAGARAAVADKSNNLHRVMKSVPREDRDDVLKALRHMKKQANVFSKGIDEARRLATEHRDALQTAGIGAGILGVGTGAKGITDAYRKGKEEDIAAMLAGREITPEQRKKRRRKRAAGVLAKTTGGAITGGLLGGLGHEARRVLPDIAESAADKAGKKLRKNIDKAGKNIRKDIKGGVSDAQEQFNLLRLLNPFKKSIVGSAEEVAKEAASPLTMGQAGLLMGGAALAPVVSRLAGAGIDRLSAKSDAQIRQDLQRVLEVHPDIGRPEDPRVQMAYDSLVGLNPQYAEDPLIAGPLLKQIVESRMDPTNPNSSSYVDPGIAKSLSEARKAIREGNPRETFGDSFGYSLGQGVQQATMGGLAGGGIASGDTPTGFLVG